MLPLPSTQQGRIAADEAALLFDAVRTAQGGGGVLNTESVRRLMVVGTLLTSPTRSLPMGVIRYPRAPR